MSFKSSFAVLCFDLRKQHNARSATVFVLCGEEVVNLNIVAEVGAFVDERVKQLEVIDATERFAVNIVFAVGTL